MVAHQQFASMDGDHATLINVFRAFRASPAKQRRDWVVDHFVNKRALKRAEDVHKQVWHSLAAHCWESFTTGSQRVPAGKQQFPLDESFCRSAMRFKRLVQPLLGGKGGGWGRWSKRSSRFVHLNLSSQRWRHVQGPPQASAR